MMNSSKKDELKSLLEQINEIDKLYNNSANSNKAYSKGPELIKRNEKIKTESDKLEALEKLKIKAENDHAKAEEAVKTLLVAYKEDSQKNIVIQQIIQDIRKRYSIIPLETSRLIHYPKNNKGEYWGNFYSQSRYEQLMPYCQLAYLAEGKGSPEEHALKLALAFDTERDALVYTRECFKHHILPMHDGCAFVLPDLNQCDFKSWKALIKTNIHDRAFRELLNHAPEIEKEISKNKPIEKINRVLIKAKKIELTEAIGKFKTLKRKHGTLTSQEEQEYKKSIQEVSKLRLELFRLSAGVSLNNYDVMTLRAAKESYLNSFVSYRIMTENGLLESDFNKFQKLKRANDDAQIPNIDIDGSDLGFPGLHLKKVDVMDEAQAAEAACFGKLTFCCQSLSGEAGEPCVIYGLTSPKSGFYVLKDDEGEVFAQSWVSRTQTGAMLFDSIEIAVNVMENSNPFTFNAKLNPAVIFFKKLFEKLTIENGVSKICCGGNSGISQHFGVDSVIGKERFIDYDGYSDAIQQRVIIDKNRPYIQQPHQINQSETIDLFIKKIIKNEPLNENVDLIEMINWAVLKSDQALIEKLKKTGQGLGIDSLIETISSYLNNSEKAKVLLNGMDEFSYLKNVIDAQGNTALMVAIEHGQADAALKLIGEKNNINEKNNNSKTPLIYAIENNLNKVAIELINKDAKIDEKDYDGETALLKAIHKENSEIALLLIKNEAKINEKGYGGQTALMYAIEKGLDKVVYALLNNNSTKINEKDDDQMTPLMYAVLSGNENYVTQLLKLGAKVNLKEEHGFTAYMLANLMGFNTIADRLAEHGAKIGLQVNYNIKGAYGKTLLISAIQRDKFALANKLLEKTNVDINVKDTLGETAFSSAMGGDNSIVMKLIEKGVNLDEKNQFGQTPLMKVASMGNLELFDLMLKHNINLDLKNQYGDTTLGILVDNIGFGFSLYSTKDNDLSSVYKEMIFKLIDAGANIHEKNSANRTPLQRVENSPELHDAMLAREQLREQLREQKMLENKPIYMPSKENIEGKLKAFVEQDNGEALIDLLTKNNHSINKLCILDEDENKCSLLMYACELGNVKAAKCLLDAGAKINKQDQDGDTALAYAVDCEAETQKEIVCLLINSGADPRLANKENETAIDRAKEYDDNHEIVKLLESPVIAVKLNRGG